MIHSGKIKRTYNIEKHIKWRSGKIKHIYIRSKTYLNGKVAKLSAHIQYIISRDMFEWHGGKNKRIYIDHFLFIPTRCAAHQTVVVDL